MSGKLVSKDIIKRIQEDNLITDYDINECVKPVSYELRVGGYWDSRNDILVNLKAKQPFEIRPGGFVLIKTREKVHLPNDILGMMYLRSTYARRGFTSWFQGIVDPGYKGGLTVILHNLTDSRVRFHGEERICHLVFEQLSEPTVGYTGTYMGSEGGTPAPTPPVPVIG